VVLLTDGRRNAAASPDRTDLANRLREQRIPVHSVVIGSDRPTHDVAVATVSVADRVILGDSIDVTATVKLEGEVPGAQIPVRLMRGDHVVQEKAVSVRSDGSRPRMTFHVPAEKVGYDAMTVVVGPVDGDIQPANDRRAFAVDVVDEKVNVLLIAGEAGWEFQYLHNALARDPHVTLEAVVFRQPEGEGLTRHYKDELPLRTTGEPDSLNTFDAIVLGDVEPGDVDDDAWGRLLRYVDERGGTLIWSGGPRVPALISRQRTARQLLPVLEPAPMSNEAAKPRADTASLPAGVRFTLISTELADTWSMLRFEDETEANRAAWESLPAQPFLITGGVKPGATALVSVFADGGSRQPAMVVMPYGLGRVFWIGCNGTWRWRHRMGDKRHHRFWGQLVRWAAGDKLAAGNKLVRFGPARRRVSFGTPVELRARFSEEAKLPAADALVVARLYRARPSTGAGAFEPMGDPLTVVPLGHSRQQPRQYEAVIPGLEAGAYLMRLDLPNFRDLPTDYALLEVAYDESSELIELTASREQVDQLATQTGGKVFLESDADAVTDAIKPQTQKKIHTETATIWDRPGPLIFFFALLTLEWILRKRAGLP
jgi:hypothetical protein